MGRAKKAKGIMGSRPKASLVTRAQSKSVKITKGSGASKRYKTNAELIKRVGSGKKRKKSSGKKRRSGGKRRR